MKTLGYPIKEELEKSLVMAPVKELRDALMNRVKTFDEAKRIDDAYKVLLEEYERLRFVCPADRFGEKPYVR